MCVRLLYVFDQCTLIDVRTRYRQADMNEGEAVDSKETKKESGPRDTTRKEDKAYPKPKCPNNGGSRKDTALCFELIDATDMRPRG